MSEQFVMSLKQYTPLFILFGFIAWRYFRAQVAAKKVQEITSQGEYTLLDVRSPGEFSSYSIPGSINVPVQSLAGRLGELDKKRPVIVYCASGMRSGAALGVLSQNGFEKVINGGSIRNVQNAVSTIPA